VLIDWFTVAAQTVNFLILVWLLKRYLYRPILNAIDEREQRIAKELADAADKSAQALAESEKYTLKNKELDSNRGATLAQLTAEVAAERQRLFESARVESDQLRAKQQDSWQREYQSLSTELAHRTQTEVFSIARQTLTDLAGVSLEARMVEVFVERLQQLDEETRRALSSQAARVRSAFELMPAQRVAIESAVKAILGGDIQVEFELAPGLISGLELIVQGQKIAWSVNDYLASLDKRVGVLFKAASMQRP
jgi:F-type H+-transporting ATPase subunit b